MHAHTKLAIGCFCCILAVAVGAETVRRTEANNGNLVMEDIPAIPAEIVDSLNRYQNVRSGRFRDWTEDGAGIYISTRFGDVEQ
ncbi:MAG: S9 family peptidase, partial [Gammaproteobacteria bacterium]|nr:S9 family peptidase [Gammaproteobacteria bacterium]